MSIYSLNPIPRAPVDSFAETFQRHFSRASVDRLSQYTTQANAVLSSIKETPIKQVEELANPEQVAHFLKRPDLFDQLRQAFGLAVPFIRPLIEGITSKTSEEELLVITQSLQVNETELASYISFADNYYKKNWLSYRDASEIVVIGWKAGQGNPIHDHGGSYGVDRVIQGTLRERRYNEALEEIESLDLRVGDVALIGADLLHQVDNPGKSGLAVSIHAYYGPIPTQNVRGFEKQIDAQLLFTYQR